MRLLLLLAQEQSRRKVRRTNRLVSQHGYEVFLNSLGTAWESRDYGLHRAVVLTLLAIRRKAAWARGLTA